jgi:DNA-binding XRE family transcriptional regulator
VIAVPLSACPPCSRGQDDCSFAKERHSFVEDDCSCTQGWHSLTEDWRSRLQERRSCAEEALAQKAGLHQTYIGMIERGLSNPSLDTANVIAEALEVSFSKLIGETEIERQRADK